MKKTNKNLGLLAGSMVAAMTVSANANAAETFYSSDLGDANTVRATLLDVTTDATYDLELGCGEGTCGEDHKEMTKAEKKAAKKAAKKLAKIEKKIAAGKELTSAEQALVAESKSMEGKCGEGKCGEEKKDEKANEGKCGEGTCGEH